MFEPISSMNTIRFASSSPATSALQTALRNSSRCAAPTDLFSAPTHAVQQPADGSTRSHSIQTRRAGTRASSEGWRTVAPVCRAAFGRLPGLLLGLCEPPFPRRFSVAFHRAGGSEGKGAFSGHGRGVARSFFESCGHREAVHLL